MHCSCGLQWDVGEDDPHRVVVPDHTWKMFTEEPENNRKLKVYLYGNGERDVFYSSGKFYKNESQRDKGRVLAYIHSYHPYSPKQNMATHWKYLDDPHRVAVPWGVWDLSGNWHHNPKLKMSADEQYRQNVQNGFLTVMK
jgi:hypothetical protein